MTVSAMRVSPHSGLWGWRLMVLALVMAGFVAPRTVWAQGLGGGGGAGGAGSRMQQAAPDKPVAPPADAVPGAKAREPAVPATKGAADLQPNDALFDAINRGDIAAARDAINRGADMNSVNVLGMTPMELSVDLGRNDISFMLLSMRGEDSGRGSRATGRDDAAAALAKSGAKTAPKQAAVAKAARGKAEVAVAAPQAIMTPKLFANDGGTPVPSAGFLGFDSRSASN
jgi:hypothetical protein